MTSNEQPPNLFTVVLAEMAAVLTLGAIGVAILYVAFGL